jgi:hypothetical protein
MSMVGYFQFENYCWADPLGYLAYNFIKTSRTRRTTPATTARMTDRLRGVANLVAAW